ncbi:hypothetical protein Tco_0899518, partial [Tanacetum coccineum]
VSYVRDIYGVCIGILACKGLSLVSSPLHAMKSQSQFKSSAAVILGVWRTTTTTTTTTAITDVEITLAQALVELKSEKPKADKQAPTPTVSSQQPSQINVQDKGKGNMVKPEPMKKMSKKDLLRLPEELAFKLQAEEEEE